MGLSMTDCCVKEPAEEILLLEVFISLRYVSAREGDFSSY